MKKVKLYRKHLFLKMAAAAIAAMIVISSAAIIQVLIEVNPEIGTEHVLAKQPYPVHPCKVSEVEAQEGLWISFDSTPPGTPAEVHLTVSDTSGITIVGNFHGFWRSSYNIGIRTYDDILMPGAISMQEPGKPMLPLLFEYVEIPRHVDIEIEELASSIDTTSGYHYEIGPAIFLDIPYGVGATNYSSLPNATNPIYFNPSVYDNNALFPGVSTQIEGATETTSLIMRGHRILGLRFHPVQYNPVTGDLTVFSQLVIKVKYNVPAQIEPVPDSLRSDIFEQILNDSLLHYDSCYFQYTPPGQPKEYSRRPYTPSASPKESIPYLHLLSDATNSIDGAEYLIVTTETFVSQASRLAAWKERKGIPSRVVTVPKNSRETVRAVIEFTYKHWDPAPTYVLLLGDVEDIPANYDAEDGLFSQIPLIPFYQDVSTEYGSIASDLGYFNIEGNGYFPDLIYSRISVDTVEQAETIVNKILQYEQNPPTDSLFYNSILSAGNFQDLEKPGVEDKATPFIINLERIRHYLIDSAHGYNVHINYSSYINHRTPLEFQYPLDPSDPNSKYVANSLPVGFQWLAGYINPPFPDISASHIVKNINDGRFLVLYFGHGGSKNNIFPVDRYPYDGNVDRNDRDSVEGWEAPCFNTTHFSDLANGDMLPLIVSIACNTGWFDGETDQDYLNLTWHPDIVPPPNPFADYENECFAENITRLTSGGAIAVIAASRPGHASISAQLMNGLIQAFWPGFLGSTNHPYYEMGAALYYAKFYAEMRCQKSLVYAVLDSMMPPEDEIRTTFEIFHLFGDPETQLWTDVPSEFDVSYPVSIGTSDPQRFVVTVKDQKNGAPVENAKVCIQQNPYIYQVGYTDPAGQIVFRIDPPDITWSINVTVTKHNYIPHLGEIVVNKGTNCKVTITPDAGLPGKSIGIIVSGFDKSYPVDVFLDNEYPVTIRAGESFIQYFLPSGPFGYVNIQAIQDTNIATNVFFRLSTTLIPDPYIYSQTDPTTWYLAGNKLVWDNPCITIYDGENPVTEVNHFHAYTVKVTVYNKGNYVASDTKVTLYSSASGGGVSWAYVGEDYVTVEPFGSSEATITWHVDQLNTACLNVSLYNKLEGPNERINNVGQESYQILSVCSPEVVAFKIGNPTAKSDPVFISVRQSGDYDNVLNVTVLDYSSQPLDPNTDETVMIQFDPGMLLDIDMWRFFTIEFFVNDELMSGIAVSAVCTHTCQWIWILLGIIIVAGVVIWHKKTD